MQTVVEIGFGNGDSLLAMARARPQCLFIGIEVHRPGIAHVLSRIAQLNITNLLPVVGDAYVILRDVMPQRSVDRLQIFFPDPWPKKSHHKRRLLNQAFLDVGLPLLKPGATLHVVTDWRPYALEIMELLQAQTSLVNTAEQFAARVEDRPVTKFEAVGIQKRHNIFEIMFNKTDF